MNNLSSECFLLVGDLHCDVRFSYYKLIKRQNEKRKASARELANNTKAKVKSCVYSSLKWSCVFEI